jgi:hypothetical protein
MLHPPEKIGSESSEGVWSHWSYSTQEEIWKVESHGLKPVATLRASKDGTLRSIPYYAHNELQGLPIPHSSTVLKPVAFCEGG